MLLSKDKVKGWVADDRLQGDICPRDLVWAELVIRLPLAEIGSEHFAQFAAQHLLNPRTVDAVYTRTMPLLGFEDLAQTRT